ncbi:mucus-binding protein precursor, LPXTG-motif cell wall anchor [Secundilactobacillus pentosiphilus]|uniref:Mucus-binding protein, LPXTG-motif cell wall anchor n=1 Tax=Secundilactobacillus pentosiphilus TaxID=1714682 RepID=A0A1Z5IP90_9LACO|nr:KxYKxGKxW signal peptide domain-containing protein [Secundilactobacillus pentosiphilus]GAX03560.1 mucus-binding protein precursor, LPXTG-motif cell wall anchor [Secundilactobacillus pentosiphilus]
MVGKNNHTKMIQSNLKERYKSYKVGRRWVFASIASLSLGAALFLGSATTSFAETTDTAATPDTQDDSTATSATAATTAKTVTLKPATQQTDKSAVGTSSSATNVTASDGNGSNQTASKNGTDAPKQATTVKAAPSEQQPVPATDVKSATQPVKTSKSNPGNNGSTVTPNDTKSVDASTTKTASNLVNDTTNVGVEPNTATKPNTQPAAQTAAQSSQVKTAQVASVVAKVDRTKADQLDAQAKTLLVDPSNIDLNQAKTVASQQYALTGEPQQIVAMAADVKSTVILTSSTDKIGYGQPADDVVITAKMTVNTGDTVTITVPTNLDDLEWSNVQKLQDSLGTTQYVKNTDGTYTVTNTFNQSGIFTQKITLKQVSNGANSGELPQLTPDQIGKDTTGEVTATLNGSPVDPLTLTQTTKPSVAISNPTRVSPALTSKDADGNPFSVDAVIPNTNYVYKVNVTDSTGLKDDSGDGINSRLNTNGTTITIPVPTGFTLDSALTDTLNGFAAGTTTIKQDASGANIIITVPANTEVGKGGFYLAGKYTNELTDTVQTLTATGNPTITQKIPNGQTLTATSNPWTEKLAAKGDGVAPAVGSVTAAGNSSKAPDKLVLDTDTSNDPLYLSSFGFGVTSSTPVTDAKMTITVPDGVDATGVVVPKEIVNRNAYLPGTTEYGYTLILADGTTETGTVAAGGTISKGNTTSLIKQIVLTPNYLAPGATTGTEPGNIDAAHKDNYIHLLGKLDAKYENGSNVKNGDGLKFNINIQMPEDTHSMDSWANETVSSPMGRVGAWGWKGGTDNTAPGKQDSGYISVVANGSSGQTIDLVYEPTLYFVLPFGTNIYSINMKARDASGNTVSNGAKISYYQTSNGQTGVKVDFAGTGLSIFTDDTFQDVIHLSNDADALPGKSYVYYYVTSPTTPISNTTKATDSKIGDPANDKSETNPNPNADKTFVDGDVNAVAMAGNRFLWTIDAATGTYVASMAQGNQDEMPKNAGMAVANGNNELDFYTNLVNAASAIKDASVAINLPETGDDQGSTYTFQLTGPVNVPTTFTTSEGTGSDPLTPTVLYSTNRYDKAGTAVDTTGYVTADQVSDWSAIRSVIVQVGKVPNNAATGRIKLTGTTANFNNITSPDKQIGYLQTILYENGAAASVTNKATSITIISKSTVNARIHYKDATGDHYIPLDSLSKTLVNNTDRLNASDFPSTEDKLTAAENSLSDTDKALINTLLSKGYYWVKNSDGSLKTTIVNSDHGDYGTDKPNKVAAFGATSQYYFDGDIVQYDLTNAADLTVTYVDTDDNNKTVGTPEIISGGINDIGSYTVTVPDGYVLATGQANMVPYTLTTDDTDNIVIKLAHEIDQGTMTTTRTITYTGLPADKTPSDTPQPITWTITTDKVTNKTTYTPSGDYAEVTVPTVAGYTPGQSTVPVGTNTATPNKPGDNTVTVNYTADPQKVTVHYIDVTGSDKTSGWTANDGSEVTTAEQTLNGTTDEAYTNTIKIPTNYVQVAADAGASSGTYDTDDKTDQSYYVYIKHATKTITPTTDPKNDQLKASITRTINYVYGADAVDGKKGTTAAPSVTQTQDFTRTGTIDLVTGDVTYSDWTPTGEGFAAVTSPTGTDNTALTGYTPDQSSVAAVATTSLTADDQPVTVTVTYHPDAQKVTVHYIDVNGSTKTSDWTADDGTEVTTAAQALSGTTDGAYTNIIKITENYVQVAADAGASSGTYDNDDKTDQNYNVYIKHATKTITPTTDPKNDQLKTTITRTINYVYGNDTVDHRKGDQAFSSVEQHQDYTRTGTVDEVTGTTTYGSWTPTTGDGEGFNAVTSGTITGYTPDKASVGQTTVDVKDVVANKVLTPVTVTYNPNAQKVEIHYIDVTNSPKTSDWTTGDGTEVASATQTLNGTTDGVYTNPLTLPMNYVKVGQDTGAVSGFFDNNGQVTQTYNVYIKHATKTITPTTDPKNDQLKATITRTINYVYGNDTVDHRKGDQAFNPVEQRQDYTRTGTVDEVTGDITYTAWTPTTGDDEGLGAVTSDSLTGYTPDQASVAQAVVDLKDVANKTLTPVTVTYNPDAQTVQIHYIDVTGSTKTSGWVPTDGTEVTSAKQTLNGTTDGVYTNPLILPMNYVKVGQDTGAVSGFFDKDSQTNQDYNVYVKHATKTITPTTDPKNDQLKATITRTINYVYGNDTVDHRKGDQVFSPVNQHQDYTRTGTVDEVTGNITYSAWTPTAGADEGLGAVTSDTLTGYTPDQTSVGQAVVGQTDVANKALTPVTVTYNPNAQKVEIHYIDITGSDKTANWLPTDGTEVASAMQTLNGTTDGVYTNAITVPMNYVKVGQDAGAASGFFDNNDQIIQSYNVYVKHATKIITPTTDPNNDQLKATITRTINYVYGNDTADHRKGDQVFNPVNQHQDYTRTGTVDQVTGTITYSDWTPTAGSGEGLGAVTSGALTGYTPDQASVGQAVIGQTDVANKALTPVTVTYNPNSVTMTVTYVDDVENGKVVEGTVLDGTVDQAGHFNVIVPNGYELSKNQKSSIDYKFTPNEAQNKIIIHLVHGIAHTTTTTTRTINYYIQGTTTPVHVATVQTLTWNVATDKVTGESVATPQGGYDKVTSPLVPGYTAGTASVDGQYPKPVTGKSVGNLTATVYYTAVPVNPDNGGEVTPPTTPETTDTTDGGTVVPNQPQNEKVPQQPNGKTTEHDRTPNQPGSDNSQNPTQSNDGTAMKITENATGQLGRSVPTPTSNKAQSVTRQRVGKATTKLPQTNEQRTGLWSVLGISLMGMMSLLGFSKRKKHDQD